MKPEIELTDTPGPATWRAMVQGLGTFNEQAAGLPEGFRFLILMLKAPDPDGAGAGDAGVIGGLWGRTLFGWLHVNVLFVPEPLRRRGLGTDLMLRAETEARARGCVGSMVDTFSFQARPFYERLGYRVFGTVEDYPPGHSCFFLKKRLDEAG
jgi:GNAT superfamily N-acetyltransferase